MRPAISGRIVTASSARRVPTALTSSTAGAIRAAAVLTGVAGGAPFAASFGDCAKEVQAKTAASRGMIRMINPGFYLIHAHGLAAAAPCAAAVRG